MSHQKLSDDANNDEQNLYDLNLLGLWCATGNEWTSLITKESIDLTHQPLDAGKSRVIRGSVLLSLMATVTLLGAATLTQVQVTSSTPQADAKTVSAN
ncbi:MAG TPA: hypothetical protein V6D11_13480 [Waterburya sp.]